MVGEGFIAPPFTSMTTTAYKQSPLLPTFLLPASSTAFPIPAIDNLPAQRLSHPFYSRTSSSCQVKLVGNRRTILTRVCGIFPLRSITCLFQIILHRAQRFSHVVCHHPTIVRILILQPHLLSLPQATLPLCLYPNQTAYLDFPASSHLSPLTRPRIPNLPSISFGTIWSQQNTRKLTASFPRPRCSREEVWPRQG